ncbi:DUF2011 domain-containing protein [Aspergillus saccharolyticus JOP 1030-1]|uniref:Uncharacterized protein n=1 Tax=Aspergillus saccharolyticus JOP 1030-1 TaxID=1450539 RepID=A0A319AB03_9EURO|nr:hypothetical protein BP01DRAFT_416861 [Aspergillus saccharolyticus JOP 1030-1]PYH44122.1 hypothetical protein BP01DRAFT_416861 [Aspergillus saccharolyticus JOP 1030-1]
MFDLPMAKRVRRDELLSRDSESPPASPPPESASTDVHQRLGQLLNLDALLAPAYPAPDIAQQQQPNDFQADDEEQEFEFRLFSAPAPTATTKPAADATAENSAANEQKTSSIPAATAAQKLRIRVRSPTPGAGGADDGRFVNPFRGYDHYFTAPGSMTGGKVDIQEEEALRAKRQQFEEVAVSGLQMLGFAQVPWPGCYLPWKVVHLKSEKKTKGSKAAGNTDGKPTTYVIDPPERVPVSSTKPGKKRRIQLRKRRTAREAAKKREEEEEQRKAEKRNRKNREQKIKRRQKAREQKAAAAAAAAGGLAEGQTAQLNALDDGASSDGGSD